MAYLSEKTLIYKSYKQFNQFYNFHNLHTLCIFSTPMKIILICVWVYTFDGSLSRARCGILIKNTLGLIKKCHVEGETKKGREIINRSEGYGIICRELGKIIFKFFTETLIDPSCSPSLPLAAPFFFLRSPSSS